MTDETGDIDTAPPADDVVDDAPEPSSAELPADGTEGEAATAPPVGDADPEGDEPKDLKDLRAKFPTAKSDKELLKLAAQTHWNSAREGSKLAKERDELKARLAELEQQAEPAEPEPEETPADLKAIDDAIGALTARQNAIPDQKLALVREVDDLRIEIRILERDLKVTAEYDQGPLKAELSAMKARLESKLDKYDSKVQLEEHLKDQIAAKQRDRALAEREVGTLKARQQQADRENARIQQEFPAEVAAHTDKVASELIKLPMDDEMKGIVRSIARSTTAVEMWRNQGRSADEVFPVAVKATVAQLVKFGELFARAAIKDMSAKKAAAARTPGAPSGSPAAATSQSAYDDIDPRMKAARERIAARLGR